MIAARRSFATAGVALMGAGIIAATPAIAPTAPAIPHFAMPDISLQASIFDIFTFPAIQQAVANEVEFVAIRATGLADSGAGLLQSALSLPTTVITATQQLFSNDPLAALDTVESWATKSVTDTVGPIVLANINVGQIQLAIQSALLPAELNALISLGNGVLNAFDAVARASIIAGQNIINAVRSLNIGNIVNAVIDGIGGVATGFVQGGQSLVDGVVGAQTLIATALKARPAPVASVAVGSAAAAPKVAAARAALKPAATAAESANAGTAAPTLHAAATTRGHRGADAASAASSSDAPKAAAGRRASR